MEGWIEQVKSEIRIEAAINACKLQRKHDAFGPCPACGAVRRGKTDERLPCTSAPSGDSWACQACSAKGDVIKLFAFSVLGGDPAEWGKEDWGKLRKWLADNNVLTEVPTTGRRGASRVSDVLGTDDLLSGLSGGRPRPRAKASGDSGRPQESDAPERPAAGRGGHSGMGPLGWRDGIVDDAERALWADSEEAQAARNYLLEIRKLAEKSIREFRLGLAVDPTGAPVITDGRPWIVIPLLDPAGCVVNARFRSCPIPGTCAECNGTDGCRDCKRYQVCAKRPLPLFNAHRLSNDAKLPVLITEGEFDVIALHSYGFGVNTVSGTAGAGKMTEAWLDLLEPYEQIIGFPDDDARGKEGWEKIVEKLGAARCSRVALPHKDVGDCLRLGVEVDVITRAIGRAEPMHGMRARRINEYADAIEELVANPGRLRGISTTSVSMDEAVGGIRPGVIVITGESGKGKTSFATWLIAEVAREQTSSMLTSFEQEPLGTVQKLLRMEVGRDFSRVDKATRGTAMGKLGEVPLWVLDHIGNIKPRKMMEVISYHARRDGIRIFLVDHLGFLIDPDVDDERRATDAVVRALALLAKTLRITIFLVVHPHNLPPGQGRVMPRDLKGSSAVRQDVDEVWCVEPLKPSKSRPWPASKIHFDKVRSEFGSAGSSATLAFDPGSSRFADRWEDTPAGRDGLLVPRSMPPDLEFG